MKCKLKVGDFEFEIEGSGEKEIFKEIGKIQETFGHKACGACKSTELRYLVRNVDDNDFFEVLCQKCGAKLAFGQHKKGGTLFPKRKDGENYLPNGGWTKWVPPAKAN